MKAILQGIVTIVISFVTLIVIGMAFAFIGELFS